MKVIETVIFHYVVPETPEEQAEIDRIVAEVAQEKFGRDFLTKDLKIVRPARKHEGKWLAGNQPANDG
jgi:hypothetical protein